MPTQLLPSTAWPRFANSNNSLENSDTKPELFSSVCETFFRHKIQICWHYSRFCTPLSIWTQTIFKHFSSMGLVLCLPLTKRVFWNLTDVTLADQVTNSIQTDNANRAMWQCKWLNLVDNFGTNASSATWWPNFKLMQVMKIPSQY